MYHMICNCASVLSDIWLLLSVLTSHYKTCPDGHSIRYALVITVSLAIDLYIVYCCLKEYKGIEKQDLKLNLLLGIISNLVMLGYWLYGINQNNCAILKDIELTFGKATFCLTCLLAFLRSMEIMLDWMQEDQFESQPVRKFPRKNSSDGKSSKSEPKRKLKRSMSITEVIIHTCNKTLSSVMPVKEETKKR